jgi:acyl-CoA thioester hydrolase
MSGQPEKILFKKELQVQWGDMDALGHVNNTVFFKYFEYARVTWFDTIKKDMLDKKGEGPILLKTDCTFLSPLVYPEKILVWIYCGKLGQTSFVLKYKILRQKDNMVCATGSSQLVWVNYQTSQSLPVHEKIKKYFNF